MMVGNLSIEQRNYVLYTYFWPTLYVCMYVCIYIYIYIYIYILILLLVCVAWQLKSTIMCHSA